MENIWGFVFSFCKFGQETWSGILDSEDDSIFIKNLMDLIKILKAFAFLCVIFLRRLKYSMFNDEYLEDT